MKTAILSVLAVMLAQSAFGRLGETVAQCDARYGRPISDVAATAPYDRKHEYKLETVHVSVLFSGGTARAVAFTSERAIPEELVSAALSGSSEGSKWEFDQGASDAKMKGNIISKSVRVYRRADGRALAEIEVLRNGATFIGISRIDGSRL